MRKIDSNWARPNAKMNEFQCTTADSKSWILKLRHSRIFNLINQHALTNKQEVKQHFLINYAHLSHVTRRSLSKSEQLLSLYSLTSFDSLRHVPSLCFEASIATSSSRPSRSIQSDVSQFQIDLLTLVNKSHKSHRDMAYIRPLVRCKVKLSLNLAWKSFLSATICSTKIKFTNKNVIMEGRRANGVHGQKVDLNWELISRESFRRPFLPPPAACCIPSRHDRFENHLMCLRRGDSTTPYRLT